MKHIRFSALCLLASLSIASAVERTNAEPDWQATTFAEATADMQDKPNVVMIFCDDLGYGDVHSLNPERGLIATPSVDQLAREGMIFTDAHTSSSVCTPSRYGLLTGRYNWRTRLQSAVVKGHADDLIAEDRPTTASFLKGQGYHTAILGKWHLNFQYYDPDTGSRIGGSGLPPVGATIPDGPVHRGFDYYHGFHHAGHMKAVIENDEVIVHDDEINMLPRLTRKAVDYIEERALTPDIPFYLHVALNSPHSPVVPSADWQGLSELGPYGDFVMETDAALGAVMTALEDYGFADNTILIFSSDNGCSAPSANATALESQGHYASAHYRGYKTDIWDGGHRVPFIVRWPGTVAPGSISDQTICLTDLFATMGEITETELPAGSAEDSVSFLPALSGNPIISTRNGVIHHSHRGYFAYRLGKWKLCLAKGSGGTSSPTESQAADSPVAQLYDMEADPSETTNLYETRPDVVRYLLRQLESDVARGRSTEGALAANDTENVVLWKNGVPGDVANELVFKSEGLNNTTVDFNNLSPATGSNNLSKFDGAGEPFATTLYLRGNGSAGAARVRALLQFDLSSLGASAVTLATLHLKGYSLNNSFDTSLQAIAAAEDWSDGPTYAVATRGTAVDGGSVISGLDGNLQRDYTLDVTEMVSAWQDEAWANHGIVLQLADDAINNGVGFQLSGEDAPRLEVDGVQVPFIAITEPPVAEPLEVLQHELLQEPDGPNRLFSLIYRMESPGTYYLQKSLDLADGSWSTVYSLPSEDTIERFSISVGTEPAAFFRVSDEDAP